MKNFKLNLKKKLNRKGFTLAELLVVVAILGILVAISVPLFASRMEAAKTSTDQANVRAAKAAAAALLMSDDELTSGNTGVYFYDADKGQLKKVTTDIKGYGQSTTEVEGAAGSPKEDDTANILKVVITRESVSSTVDSSGSTSGIVLTWVDPTSGT